MWSASTSSTCTIPRHAADRSVCSGISQRIRDAFAFLESAVTERKIGAYGMATWNAFREDPKSPGFLSLEAMAEIASEVGGAQHHFRFVQLPFNLAMPEALTRPNQSVAGKTMPMVQAARDLGITLVTSAALLQGQLTKNLPPFVYSALKLKKESELALAICALGARPYHGPCRHESCRARPSESCARGRRTGIPRAVHDAVRVEGLGCVSGWLRIKGSNAVGISLVQPCADCCRHLVELPSEKMIGPLDDDQLLRFRQRVKQFIYILLRAKLIAPALDK